jgi:enamine deaminase RidA (YjgF/YER057c/UK114 family)
MNENSESNKVVPVKSVEVGFTQQSSDGDSVICYRMEPAKRMLNGRECGSVCSANPSGNGNGSPPCLLSDQSHTVINLKTARRVALMITPQAEGDVVDQAWEAVSTIRAVLKQQNVPMTVTSQTVFLQRAEDAERCQKLFQAYFGERMPATNFVVQPPCTGQALAIEAWAIGGENVDVQFPQADVVSIAYDGLRWIQISGINPSQSATTAYGQTKETFDEMAHRLELAGASFDDVVRTWLYQGGITEPEQEIERYRELNRARTDFFTERQLQGQMCVNHDGSIIYPASTGIGMAGRGLAVSCLALQTEREDVLLLPLENPLQTSAFKYSKSFSAKSPKFSRAIAEVIGDYVTTWISGTASIVNSETVHLGDIEKQTEQTIDNIQYLISPENFATHGVPETGAQLGDLAKVRVYIKRREDYEKCRAICERRFGNLPTIYAHADVCRSDLLVEIEGVAFSRLDQTSTSSGGD